MSEEKIDKNVIIPVVLMGGLFLLIYGLVLSLINPFVQKGGVSSAFENINDPFNILYIIIVMIIFTAIILIIAKYWKEKLIQFIILGAVGYTSFFAFFLPLFTIYLPFFAYEILIILSIICALMLVILLYKYPEWYVIDIAGIIVGVGAIIIFGISLSVTLVIILLVALAIYDAISVYKTKHMVDLADTVMDLKLPVLMVIPKKIGYSLIKETKRLKEKLEEGSEREAFFIGLGDIVMPGILIVSAYNFVVTNNSFVPIKGLYLAISTIIGTLVGFSFLMIFVLRGKPQAGLPLLCGGAIIGYIIGSIVIFGSIVGLVLPW